MTSAILLLSAILLHSPLSALAAPNEGPCAAAFPEADWVEVAAGEIAVYASAVTAPQRARFSSEITEAAGWIGDELGAVDGAVCLVGAGSGFDRQRFTTPSLLFHAAVAAEDGVVAINTDQPGRVGAAGAYGLTHLRLWQESAGSGWPEPLASAIAHWYESRLDDRVQLRHAEARAVNMFTVTSQVDWAATVQPPLLLWDPSSNESVIGDLVAYTVAAEGEDVLLDPDPDRWAQREERWRLALRAELTGREGSTTLWMWGVALVVALLGFATAMATLGFWSKRRRLRRRPTPPPLPGFFEGGDRPTVDSSGDRR